MFAAILAVTAFAVLSSSSVTAGDAGDYDEGDIAVINNIIDNNGLKWAKADPADGSYAPSGWNVLWSADTTSKRITQLRVYYEDLTGTLDVSGLTRLEALDCSSNRLISLDVSGLTALRDMGCNNNNLTSLDVSGLTSLQNLSCSNNNLTSLDVSGPTRLYSLNCSNNNLTLLDVSGLTALRYLYCSYNSLTSLKVEATITGGINCQNNFLETHAKIVGYGGSWDSNGFWYTPQKRSIDISDGMAVTEIKDKIEAVLTSGHTPFVTGSKTNASEALIIDLSHTGKELFWDAVYSGSGATLELKGYGLLTMTKDGSLTVTGLVTESVYIAVTGKMTAGSFLATDECGIYAHNGGEVVIKGDAVFEDDAYMEAENGRITVDGNAVADASDWSFIGAYGRTGEIVIKGNVTTIAFAVEAWNTGKVTVHGDVVITGDEYAIGCWGNGTVHVKGNVTAENGYAINIGGGVVKIDGSVTVADRDRHTRDGNKDIYILESEFTANSGGYDSMYSGDGWTVYVGKQPDGGDGGDNTLLIVAIAVAVILALVVVYFVFVRKPSA